MVSGLYCVDLGPGAWLLLVLGYEADAPLAAVMTVRSISQFSMPAGAHPLLLLGWSAPSTRAVKSQSCL